MLLSRRQPFRLGSKGSWDVERLQNLADGAKSQAYDQSRGKQLLASCKALASLLIKVPLKLELTKGLSVPRHRHIVKKRSTEYPKA